MQSGLAGPAAGSYATPPGIACLSPSSRMLTSGVFDAPSARR